MSQIPRIGLDLSYLRPRAGGAMNYAESLLRTMPPGLAARTHAVVSRSAAAEMQTGSVATSVVNDPFRGRLEALRALRRREHDVIHWSGNFMLPSGSRPTMLTIHDFMSEHYREQGFDLSRGRLLQGQLVARSVRTASVVVVHDELHRDWVRDRRGDDRVALAPLGPGPWVGTPASDLPAAVVGRDYVLMLGSDLPHKRIAAFVSELLADPACAGLSVVHTAAPLELSDPRVVEVGKVDAPELAALMESASALVMPSTYEGFGIPILEAAVFGVPVVTTPHCPARVSAARFAAVHVGEGLGELVALTAQAVTDAGTRRDPTERMRLYEECWHDYHQGSLAGAQMALR